MGKEGPTSSPSSAREGLGVALGSVLTLGCRTALRAHREIELCFDEEGPASVLASGRSCLGLAGEEEESPTEGLGSAKEGPSVALGLACNPPSAPFL